MGEEWLAWGCSQAVGQKSQMMGDKSHHVGMKSQLVGLVRWKARAGRRRTLGIRRRAFSP